MGSVVCERCLRFTHRILLHGGCAKEFSIVKTCMRARTHTPLKPPRNHDTTSAMPDSNPSTSLLKWFRVTRLRLESFSLNSANLPAAYPAG